MSQQKESSRTITTNRKAYHDYHIIETFETGIVLTGTEIKSIRGHHVNLKDSYALIENGELWLYKMHISPYSHGNRFNHEPLRHRKLLIHKYEFQRLIGKTKEKGLTLIPLKLYWKRNWVKVELALAKGKKLYDKREAIAEKDVKRQIERAMRHYV